MESIGNTYLSVSDNLYVRLAKIWNLFHQLLKETLMHFLKVTVMNEKSYWNDRTLVNHGMFENKKPPSLKVVCQQCSWFSVKQHVKLIHEVFHTYNTSKIRMHNLPNGRRRMVS